MGGDSAGVSGLDINIRLDEKVFQNGPMLFGYTTSFRMGQLLRFKLKIPRNTVGNDYEFMCTEFVDEVKKIFKNNGYSIVNNNNEQGGTFLVGYKGTIYAIYDDFQVEIIDEVYNTCGCGTYYAQGALEILKNDNTVPTKDKIYSALSVASKNSGGVSEPFNIIDKSY